MRSDLFHVLVFNLDESLTQQVIAKVKTAFGSLPCKFAFESSKRRLESELKEHRHDLVLLFLGGIEPDPETLLIQLVSLSSSSRFIVFSTLDLHSSDSIISIKVPIQNWQVPITNIIGSVPDHLAIRHGLEIPSSALRLKLEKYSEKFKTEGDFKTDPIKVIPSIWYQTQKSISNSPTSDESEHSKTGITSLVYQLDEKQRKKALITEIGCLLGVYLIAGCIYYFLETESSDRILSFRTLAISMAVISTLGFFVSRGLERIWFNQRQDEE